MFFCSGVDRKNVLSLARKYIMTISVVQHSEKSQSHFLRTSEDSCAVASQGAYSCQ